MSRVSARADWPRSRWPRSRTCSRRRNASAIRQTVPIGVFALAVVTKLYTVRSVRTAHRMGYWGGVGLVWCLVPLLLVAEQGREWGWASPAALACYTAGLLGLGFFLAVEHAMGEHALIPFSLFRIGAFAQVNVVNFFGGVDAFTALAFIPLHLQIVTGLSPTAAGLLLLPQSVATTVGAKLCGPMLARGIHYRFPLGPGLGIMSLSYLALALAGVDTPVWVIAVVVTVMGFGLGLFIQNVIAALQNSVPPASIGVAAGCTDSRVSSAASWAPRSFYPCCSTSPPTGSSGTTGRSPPRRNSPRPHVIRRSWRTRPTRRFSLGSGPGTRASTSTTPRRWTAWTSASLDPSSRECPAP